MRDIHKRYKRAISNLSSLFEETLLISGLLTEYICIVFSRIHKRVADVLTSCLVCGLSIRNPSKHFRFSSIGQKRTCGKVQWRGIEKTLRLSSNTGQNFIKKGTKHPISCRRVSRGQDKWEEENTHPMCLAPVYSLLCYTLSVDDEEGLKHKPSALWWATRLCWSWESVRTGNIQHTEILKTFSRVHLIRLGCSPVPSISSLFFY